MGELPIDDSPAEYGSTLLSLKWSAYKSFNWSLNEIDSCDICNLLAFIHFKPDHDPNVREIEGKTYYRVTKPPIWL